MLNRQSLIDAVPLANVAEDQGIIIVPKQGSILGDMVAATVVLDLDTIIDTNNGVMEPAIGTIAENTNSPDGTNMTNHDVVINNAVPTIAALVNSHVAHARNITRPIISILTDAVIKEVSSLITKPVDLPEIKVIPFPKPLGNESFTGMAEDSTKVANPSGAKDLKLRGNWPSIDSTTVFDCLKTGIKSLDEDISIWANGVGVDRVVELYDNAFTSKGVGASLNELINSNFRDRANAAIAIYLMANYFEKHVPDGVTMSAIDFKDYITETKRVCGIEILRQAISFDSDIKRGVLVSYIDNKIVYVNEIVYSDWLKNGGSNNVLLGAMVTPNLIRNGNGLTVSEIATNQDKFAANWDLHLAYSEQTNLRNKYNIIRYTLSNEFSKFVYTDNVEFLGDEQLNKATAPAYIKTFNEMLSRTHDVELDNLYVAVAILVCRTLYPGRADEEILMGINEVATKNPKLPAYDAASVAIYEYINRWILSMIEVKKINRPM